MAKLTFNQQRRIEKELRPGDIILSSGHPKWWQFWLHLTYWGIHRVQTKLFGELAFNPTHVRLVTLRYKLGNKVYRGVEQTSPYAKGWTWDEIKDNDIEVWRPVRLDEMDSHDRYVYERGMTHFGVDAVRKRLPYDYGDLFDDFGHYELEWSEVPKKVFGRDNRFVCSSFGAVCHEAGRKSLEKATGVDWPRLFKDVYVEAVTPAHFSNRPDCFCRVG